MISEIVRLADPACERIDVAAVLRAVFRQRPQLRTLAEVLQTRPDLLTSGRPEGPRAIERLVRALREAGAEQLALPRCGDCGRERPLTGLGDGARICSACSNRRLVRANPCVICGSTTFVGRDRFGRPRCRAHPPWGATDPAQELAKLIAAGPFGVSPATAQQAIRSVEPTRPGQLRLLWALEDVPGLLTGRGAEGPPKISALAQTLIDRGARGVVVPLCPFCQRSTDLKQRRDGLRCCEPCRCDSKIATCVACGRVRPIGGRRFDGQPVCGTCRQHDPFNHRPCSVCGEMRLRNSRTDDGGVCAACREIPTALCGSCGARRPCYFAATDAPKCLPCSQGAQGSRVRQLWQAPACQQSHRGRRAAVRKLRQQAQAVRRLRRDLPHQRPDPRGRALVPDLLGQASCRPSSLHPVRVRRTALPARTVRRLRTCC
ncbi:hypothetical protein [Streptomyces sp. NPDC052107]|uniref:hypothetical protein n=1 Tax=Streptomyces sp. NPDC052107 TaxID=3155632 RepID=UPI00341443C9